MREIKNINKNNTLKVIDEIRRKNAEANKILLDIKKTDEALDNAELVCTKTDGTKYDFNRFLFPLKFIEKIHNYKITLNEARNNQTELGILINKLNYDYNPKNPKKVKDKNNVLKSARKLLDARKDIIDFFEKGIFPEFLKMEAIFMNTENSKTNELHRFKLDLTDKLNLKNKKKYGFS